MHDATTVNRTRAARKCILAARATKSVLGYRWAHDTTVYATKRAALDGYWTGAAPQGWTSLLVVTA